MSDASTSIVGPFQRASRGTWIVRVTPCKVSVPVAASFSSVPLVSGAGNVIGFVNVNCAWGNLSLSIAWVWM